MHFRILLIASLLSCCHSSSDSSTANHPDPAAVVEEELTEVPDEPPARPTILISVVYPGADPIDVERSVAASLERCVLPVPGLASLRTVSREAYAETRLTFDDAVDVDEMVEQTRLALAAEHCSFPGEAEVPLLRIDYMQSPVATVVVAGNDLSTVEKTLRANEIRRSLQSIEGVTELVTLGAVEENIEVRLDPSALLAFGVTPVEVVRAIQTDWANLITLSAGTVGDQGPYVVRTGAEPDIETLGTLAIRRVDTPVLVRDVATIVRGPSTPSTIVRLGDDTVVALDVFAQPEANRAAVIEAVEEAATGASVLLWSATEPVSISVVGMGEDEHFARAVAEYAAGLPGRRVALIGRVGEPHHAELRLWSESGGIDTESLHDTLRDTPPGLAARRQPSRQDRRAYAAISTNRAAADHAADMLVSALDALPEVLWAMRADGTRRPEVRTSLDRRALADLGINIADVYQALRVMGDGMTIGDAVVSLPAPSGNLTEWDLLLRDGSGQVRTVPFGSIATVTLARAPSALERHNGLPAVFVELSLRNYDEAAIVAITQAVETLDLPPGTAVEHVAGSSGNSAY